MTTHAPSGTVPAVNSLDNDTGLDVIGNKSDRTHDGGDSIYAQVHEIEEHVHMAQKIYPTLASAVTVTGGAGAWALGSFIEIVPASTITEAFDIHYINVETTSAAGVFELVLYQGASDTEVCRCRFSLSAALDLVSGIPVQTVIIPANARIRAKIASAAGGAQTADITVAYHTY